MSMLLFVLPRNYRSILSLKIFYRVKAKIALDIVTHVRQAVLEAIAIGRRGQNSLSVQLPWNPGWRGPSQGPCARCLAFPKGKVNVPQDPQGRSEAPPRSGSCPPRACRWWGAAFCDDDISKGCFPRPWERLSGKINKRFLERLLSQRGDCKVFKKWVL